VFQSVDAARLSAPSVAASLLLHSGGILLLCLVSFLGSPFAQRARRPLAPVALIAPALEIPAVRTPLPRRLSQPGPKHDLPPSRVSDLVRVPLAEPAPAPELPGVTSQPLSLPAPPLSATSLPATPVPRNNATVKAAGFASAEHAGADISPRRLTALGGFEAASTAAATAPRGGVTPASGFAQERAPPAASSAQPGIRGAAGFGDASVAEPSVTAPPAHRTATFATDVTVSAEILDKPRPSYTEEARRLGIEGEVLLEVRFEASGEAKILRVLRGLGHGLDESAISAASQIHFRPARNDSVAIDSSAVVHIIFQLAN
jgi:TonB family protein